MAHLQEAMTQLFRTTQGSKANAEDKNEMGLAMMNEKCYRCGKKGHKGYQCNKRGRKKGQGSGSKEKCNRCGKA
eukprot:10523072-Ditylum_brightwellii.AAC.1